MHRLALVLVLASLVACTTATRRQSPAQELGALSSPARPSSSATPDAGAPVQAAPDADVRVQAAPGEVIDRPALRTDDRVSASAGGAGEVTVLWPRIIPADPAGARTQQALALQKRLESVADVELMGWGQDVRPAPERVCPQAGCKGVALGVLLIHKGAGCAAVALVSTPGRSPTRLIPWVGELTLKRDMVAFRDPPESEVVVRDFVPCTELAARLADREPQVREAVRTVRQASLPAD